MVLKKQLKLPEINSYGLGVPVFQSYGNKLIYGEYNERYYFVEGHKFKKKREIISYPKSAGRYVFQGIYKKGIDSNDFIGYMDYDPKSNIQKFELYMVNKEAYRKVFSTSFETQTALAVKPFKLYDYVVNEDKVVVLDAVNHLLFLIVDSSKVISIDIASILNYDLSASSTKGHKIRLLNDFKTGTNYVAVYSERLFELYRIRITDHDIRLVKIKTIDYFSASVQIYDDYIYSLFKSKQDESYSVYRKSIR